MILIAWRKARMVKLRIMERIMCLVILFTALDARRSMHVDLPVCPRKCICLRQSIDCAHRRFSSFPAGSWSDAWELNLEDNHVGLMKAEDLRNFVSLHLLNVRRNILRELDLGALASLSYLTTVVLDNNRIESVWCPEPPPVLPRLMRIDLSSNALSEMPRALLETAPQLRELRLAYNKILKIRAVEHPTLRLLDLSANWIREIPPDAFYRLRNLEELYLANNSLTTLGDNMRKMRRLKVLDISGNNFKRLHGSDLPPFQKLHTLSLLYNPLKDISPGSIEKALSPIGALVDARGSLAACRCHLRNLQQWGATRHVEVYSACPQSDADPLFCDRSNELPLKLVDEEDFLKQQEAIRHKRFSVPGNEPDNTRTGSSESTRDIEAYA